MKKFYIILILGIIVLALVSYFCIFKKIGSSSLSQISSETSKMFCQTDDDCACGVDKETGECAYGNKQFIDTSKQCPDFCTGIHGSFEIKCVNNVCKMQLVK